MLFTANVYPYPIKTPYDLPNIHVYYYPTMYIFTYYIVWYNNNHIWASIFQY